MHYLLLSVFLFPLLATSFAQAQSTGVSERDAVVLTLENAVEIALERNYLVRSAALDVAAANAQVREAYGQVMPTVDATSSYTRNVVSPNPFAGSDAGGLFATLSLLDWLAFNETARTDGDPGTSPISLDEFRRRQSEGFADAGLSLSASENPFAVPNQFLGQISITQTLYNGSVFAAIRGARGLREINQAALTQQQHQIVHQTRQLYYSALLAQEQAEVSRASVSRATETAVEMSRLVAAGTLPVLDRLSAEVELTNLETQLLQAENQASMAGTNLLFALGIPVDQPVVLRGNLDLPEDVIFQTVSVNDALAIARERRPEVQQARLAVQLQEVNRDITRAGFRPIVSAFANIGLQGNVPDDRTVIRQGGASGDPFSVTAEERGFFSSSFWNPSVAVGGRVTWNLFNGFQTNYQVQRNTIAVQQAGIEVERAEQMVALEVDQAVRSLQSARQRILAQSQNVERARTAYMFASTRLTSGVAGQVDVRLASGQLDQAQLGFLQAVFDYLLARSDLQRAVGIVLPEPPPGTPVLFTSID